MARGPGADVSEASPGARGPGKDVAPVARSGICATKHPSMCDSLSLSQSESILDGDSLARVGVLGRKRHWEGRKSFWGFYAWGSVTWGGRGLKLYSEGVGSGLPCQRRGDSSFLLLAFRGCWTSLCELVASFGGVLLIEVKARLETPFRVPPLGELPDGFAPVLCDIVRL